MCVCVCVGGGEQVNNIIACFVACGGMGGCIFGVSLFGGSARLSFVALEDCCLHSVVCFSHLALDFRFSGAPRLVSEGRGRYFLQPGYFFSAVSVVFVFCLFFFLAIWVVTALCNRRVPYLKNGLRAN